MIFIWHNLTHVPEESASSFIHFPKNLSKLWSWNDAPSGKPWRARRARRPCTSACGNFVSWHAENLESSISVDNYCRPTFVDMLDFLVHEPSWTKVSVSLNADRPEHFAVQSLLLLVSLSLLDTLCQTSSLGVFCGRRYHRYQFDCLRSVLWWTQAARSNRTFNDSHLSVKRFVVSLHLFKHSRIVSICHFFGGLTITHITSRCQCLATIPYTVSLLLLVMDSKKLSSFFPDLRFLRFDNGRSCFLWWQCVQWVPRT